MTSHEIELSYASLVKDYNDALNTKLRGFRPAADFLELWVPDANITKSLLNMLEAAEMGGVGKFAIELEAVDVGNLNKNDLVNLSSSIAELEFVAKSGKTQIQVQLKAPQSFSPGKTSTKDHRSPYRLALGEIASRSSPQHEGTLDGAGIYKAEEDGVILALKISEKTKLIEQARHRGVVSPEGKALFDLICDIVEGLPIQEAAEHALIKAEYHLRLQTGAEPVRGIVTPRNADAIFQQPLRLLRSIYANFKKAAGEKEQINFFDRPPSATWMGLSEAERVQKVSNFVATRYSAALPKETILTVSRIDGEGGFRVFFTWEGEAPSAVKGAYLMKLERALRDHVEPRLEIFLEEWKDQNTKRRL